MSGRKIVAAIAVVAMIAALLLGWFFVIKPGVTANAKNLTYAEPPKVPSGDSFTLDTLALPTSTDGQTDPYDAAAMRWTPAAVKELWAPVAQAATEGKWKAWGYVIDAYTGEVLLDQDASVPMTPASTTKLLTALVALEDLPYTDRLATGVSLEDDTIYLWGQGDLLLVRTDSEIDNNARVASLETLARHTATALKERNLDSIALDYQSTLFSGESRLAAWNDQGVDNFAGEVAPFAIDTGRIAPGEYQFFSDSAQEVAQEFVAQLQKQGIEVTSVQPGEAPQGSEILGRVKSAEVGQQLRFMLEHSDNTMAEQYCHLAAARSGAETTFAGSSSHVIETLDQMKLDVSGLSLQDCSGLSSNNKITPKQLVQALQHSFEQQNTRTLTRLLPRGGIIGTLSERLDLPPLSGNVQAKTGSLGEVSSLAGVMTTSSNQTLLFAIGTDQVPDEGAYGTRIYLDNFLEALATQP